jgi:hypothetical protein
VARAIVIAVVAATPLATNGAASESLQDAWNAHAAPADGYDYVLDLDTLTVYTGGLLITNQQENRIRGHGAILDLEGDSILILDSRMDLENCVVANGGGLVRDSAVYYGSGAWGHVRNCVFYGNRWGLHMNYIWRTQTSVSNCVFMSNVVWGAVLHDVYTADLGYSAAFANGEGLPPADGGHFALWCGCPGSPPEPFEPPTDAHCLFADPMFVLPALDPLQCDFHLRPGSPCLGTGDPPGTDMGAYQHAPVAVEPATWGAIKGHFR